MQITKTMQVYISQLFLLISKQHELHDLYFSSDSCLLKSEETLGLSSTLAAVIVIESLVIVVLLIIIIKAIRWQKLHSAHKNEVSSN